MFQQHNRHRHLNMDNFLHILSHKQILGEELANESELVGVGIQSAMIAYGNMKMLSDYFKAVVHECIALKPTDLFAQCEMDKLTKLKFSLAVIQRIIYIALRKCAQALGIEKTNG